MQIVSSIHAATLTITVTIGQLRWREGGREEKDEREGGREEKDDFQRIDLSHCIQQIDLFPFIKESSLDVSCELRYD